MGVGGELGHGTSKLEGDLENMKKNEKSDGGRFPAFLFFCVRERRTRHDPNPKSQK